MVTLAAWLQVDVEEALVVADVEVGLGAVVGHEDLAVLERVHRARIDVEVRVELLHHDAQSARREQIAEARGRQALAQRGNDTTGHEDVLGRVVREFSVRIVCAAFIHHGLIVYATFEPRSCRHAPIGSHSAPVERMPRARHLWQGTRTPHQAAFAAAMSSSSRACASPLSESARPDSRRAISASRSRSGELSHARRGDLPVGALDHAEVVRGEGRDLREVGHDDDL